MSKNEKKKGKYAAKGNQKTSGIRILMILVILLAVVTVLLLIFGTKQEVKQPQSISQPTADATAITKESLAPIAPETVAINLGCGIYATDIGSYTGMYMEDGSDEIVSGILMLVVENNGEQDIQYAEITMDLGQQQASFSLTTLPVGEKMVLLEKTRMAWDSNVDYTAYLPAIGSIAYFTEPMSLHEEELKIQIVDGAINITNISEADIVGNIVVYYKNAAADIYYGGITYRVTLEGGLKAGEIRQIMTNHASDTGSEIMFVTISQE